VWQKTGLNECWCSTNPAARMLKQSCVLEVFTRCDRLLLLLLFAQTTTAPAAALAVNKCARADCPACVQPLLLLFFSRCSQLHVSENGTRWLSHSCDSPCIQAVCQTQVWHLSTKGVL